MERGPARLCRRAAWALVAATACTGAPAADWKPEKRVEVIVPNAPGGGNDRVARLVGKIMQETRLIESAPTVVNKPGGGQVVGVTYLNQFAGDGHHVAVVSATLLGNFVLGRSTVGPGDVTPVTQLFTEYVVFAVLPGSGIRGAKDLLARLKADVGSVSAAISGGPGNHNHIAIAQVARSVGGEARALKVASFNSGSESITAALGGHVDMVIAPSATLYPHVQAGRLRALAVAAPQRLRGEYSGVPTWKELGAAAELSNWRVLAGPRGMTPPQVAFWEGAIARVVESAEWKEMLEKSRLDGEFLRSAQTRSQLKAEHDELRAVMVDLGLLK